MNRQHRRGWTKVDMSTPRGDKLSIQPNGEIAVTRENTKTFHPLGTREAQRGVDMSTLSTPHALYRFWNDEQQLLYVGITLDPGRRWHEHRNDKPWWSEVASITIETHPNRTAVLAAEQTAIRTEHPAYNITHNRPGQASSIAETVIADDMPDACHDHCRDTLIYLPYKWRDGQAFYRCHHGHRWTCWWGHDASGDDRDNAGRPIA